MAESERWYWSRPPPAARWFLDHHVVTTITCCGVVCSVPAFWPWRACSEWRPSVPYPAPGTPAEFHRPTEVVVHLLNHRGHTRHGFHILVPRLRVQLSRLFVLATQARPPGQSPAIDRRRQDSRNQRVGVEGDGRDEFGPGPPRCAWAGRGGGVRNPLEPPNPQRRPRKTSQ